mmetsp:Transcript_19544/g.44708  ORF Transcript_19544/g.44708 Transcript_19544/m.44708 type:complete len:297 (+) Transcript_19544:3046-3936(+)
MERVQERRVAPYWSASQQLLNARPASLGYRIAQKEQSRACFVVLLRFFDRLRLGLYCRNIFFKQRSFHLSIPSSVRDKVSLQLRNLLVLQPAMNGPPERNSRFDFFSFLLLICLLSSRLRFYFSHLPLGPPCIVEASKRMLRPKLHDLPAGPTGLVVGVSRGEQDRQIFVELVGNASLAVLWGAEEKRARSEGLLESRPRSFPCPDTLTFREIEGGKFFRRLAAGAEGPEDVIHTACNLQLAHDITLSLCQAVLVEVYKTPTAIELLQLVQGSMMPDFLEPLPMLTAHCNKCSSHL